MDKIFYDVKGKECCDEELALSILLKEEILFANTRKFVGIKFVSDSNIGRAECLIETPKGIVESLIEKNLEQISKALEKAE